MEPFLTLATLPYQPHRPFFCYKAQLWPCTIEGAGVFNVREFVYICCARPNKLRQSARRRLQNFTNFHDSKLIFTLYHLRATSMVSDIWKGPSRARFTIPGHKAGHLGVTTMVFWGERQRGDNYGHFMTAINTTACYVIGLAVAAGHFWPFHSIIQEWPRSDFCYLSRCPKI